MSQEENQFFPFSDFEAYFRSKYHVARDGEKLLIKMTEGDVPYSDGRAAVLVEFRKWIFGKGLNFWWSKDMVHSAAMWITAGAQQIDRSVLAKDHLVAKKPVLVPRNPAAVVPARPADAKVIAPPLKPIPTPRSL